MLPNESNIEITQEDIDMLRKTQDASVRQNKAVNFNDLPESKQEELAASMSETMARAAKTFSNIQAGEQATEPAAGPAVKAKKYQIVPKDVNLDDWKTENVSTQYEYTQQQTAAPAPQPEAQPIAPPVMTKYKTTDITQQDIIDATIDEKKRLLSDILNNISDADLPDSVRLCPYCDHDRAVELGAVPDATDKENYLLCLMSLQPFRKQFLEFNGKLIIEFRELKQYEIDSCERELRQSIKRGSNTQMDQLVSLESLRRFLMALSLYAIYPSHLGIADALYVQPHELKEFTVTNPKTGDERPIYFRELIEQVTDKLGSQSLFNVLTKLFTSFSNIVSNLSAHYDSPDFWKTT